MSDYTPVIGLEVHIQINKTNTKMFSAVSNDVWQQEPNSRVSPVELGLPGALPVPNKTAVTYTQRFGAALHCSLLTSSKFDRKNYFYPDLPKGYQISQYDQPLCANGYLEFNIRDENGVSHKKRVDITRIHLEEDTGKSIHRNGKTYLDYNKAGVPLMELVTEPDFTNAEEVSEFCKTIQYVVRKLGISDADMEKGQMRLEANVSVRKPGQTALPDYRVEMKNINSFKFMRDAVNYEIARQIEAHEKGETLFQETRGWNESKQETYTQRSKEEAHDYRYFPEPDIPPMTFTDEEITSIIQSIPEMPWETRDKLILQGVREDYAIILAFDDDKQKMLDKHIESLDDINQIAKIIVNASSEEQISQEIENKKRPTISGDGVDELIQTVLNRESEAVAKVKSGNENVIKYLVGQVMKESRGAADPAETEQKIKVIIEAD